MNTRTTPGKTLMALGLVALAGLSLAADPPFGLFHIGNFQRMTQQGETAGVAAISDLPNASGTWGVGATAGLKGEMIQLDGRFLVSPGSDARGTVRAPEQGEQALLWAGARVSQWMEVEVPHTMNQATFEALVQEQAKTSGLSLAQAFVFRVVGQFPRLRWHVVTGEKTMPDAGHSGGAHANLQSSMKLFHSPGALGQLVGIYSGQDLEGVVSHPGERFHLHYADDNASISGHVDAYAVAAGTVLMLPKP